MAWCGMGWPNKGQTFRDSPRSEIFWMWRVTTCWFILLKFSTVFVPGLIFPVGKSKHPTAGSFIRPQRRIDKPLSFLEAAHEKYVSEWGALDQRGASGDADIIHKPIEISGKVVEEVGFEKIRKQLAELQALRIVLLDGMCIQGVLAGQGSPKDYEEELRKIRQTFPKIVELDLSRNLLRSWTEVENICMQLKDLRILKLKYAAWNYRCFSYLRTDIWYSGNRFDVFGEDLTFNEVSELSLDETLMDWSKVWFPGTTSQSYI